MDRFSEHRPEIGEHQVRGPAAPLTYDEYMRHYEHFRLRLEATFQCAQEHRDAGLTDNLLTVESVNKDAESIVLYESPRLDAIHPESELTFQASPEVFRLPDHVRSSLGDYGLAIASYYASCLQLIHDLPREHVWRRRLDHHKPEWMIRQSLLEGSHLFLRPDFILTEDEPVVTEIETSPFGMPLAHFLNATYRNAGQETLVDASVLMDEFLGGTLGAGGPDKALCFVHTEHTRRYRGQLEYFAGLLRGRGVNAVVLRPEELQISQAGVAYDHRGIDRVYRGFYLYEALENQAIEDLILLGGGICMPPCKPQLEEKALMGMLFEPEFEDHFAETLGDRVDLLKRIFPRTWVVDAQGVPGDFPRRISSWEDLAEMSRRERQFVLKISGFSSRASWAKGIIFLNKLSKQKCRDTMRRAVNGADLFVVQEFRRGAEFAHPYFDFQTRRMKTMRGRVRFTPYYAVRDGRLLTAKATLCENTDYIHAMVDSVNVPVV